MDKDKFLSVMVLVHDYLLENKEELEANQEDGYVEINENQMLVDDLEFELEEAKVYLGESFLEWDRDAWARRVKELRNELNSAWDAIDRGRVEYDKATEYLELLDILPTLD